MEQNQNGSKAYLISIVMVAVLGGLLFGYIYILKCIDWLYHR